MCATCGCGSDGVTIDGKTVHAAPGQDRALAPGHAHSHDQSARPPDHEHEREHVNAHDHGHDHAHEHDHGHDHPHEHGHEHHNSHAHDNDNAHAHDHAHDASHARNHGHAHDHGHDHAHAHADAQAVHGRTVSLEQDILAGNQLLAERNRGWFAGRDVFAVNLMSSPGAGKTSILERTIRDLRGRDIPISVLEGDQATSADAERIRATGAAAVQINTGTGCHLDAHMVAHGVAQLALAPGSILLIENVGNLVCPALFDLGEEARVVVTSVTEGDDKPLKYPHMFRTADMLLINKLDLLPHVRFDVERCIDHARQVNPQLQVLLLSAETGEGMPAWYDWLTAQRALVMSPA
jgi:hydrogenase nickel incorporation protein HypB